MEVNGKRFEASMEAMRKIGFVSPEEGINRLGLNENDKQARNLFVRWLKDAGLEVRIDPIGNILGIRPDKNGNCDKPVIMGSHLDTVGQGGAFDGAVGVMGGLEVLRTLNDHDVKTDKPVAVMNFTHEEGPRFKRNMMGSVALTGDVSLDVLYGLKDHEGITVLEALQATGYLGTDPWVKADSYFELHIEQGPVLEAEQLTVGVVQGIQGIVWYECAYLGFASHAGPTPLHLRRDSLLGAAELFVELRKLAENRQDGTVVTVGCCDIEPNEINVIAGKTRFTIDVRQFDRKRYDEMKRMVLDLVERTARKHNLEWTCTVRTEVFPVAFDAGLVDLVEEGARTLGCRYKRMPSGAGHDAQLMAAVYPTAMVFVPSAGGVSHTPVEHTEYPDLIQGVKVLLYAVLRRSGAEVV